MPIFSEEFKRGLYEKVKDVPKPWYWGIGLILWAWGYWISEMAAFEADDYCVSVAADYLSRNGLSQDHCINVANGFAAKILADAWLYVMMNVFLAALVAGFFLSFISMILMEKYEPKLFRKIYYNRED